MIAPMEQQSGQTVASTAEIRAAFPALERVWRGHPVAYFDGPGGTQVPRAVVEAMADYLVHHNANTHWAFPTSAETDTALTHARSPGGLSQCLSGGDRIWSQHDHVDVSSGAGLGTPARGRRCDHCDGA